MTNIVIKPAAKADLIDIWHYSYENWGKAQADSYLFGLESAFNKLANLPALGRDISFVHPDVKLYPHSHHLIIFRLNEDSLEIVRI